MRSSRGCRFSPPIIGCLSGGTISLTLQKHFGISLINARRGAFTVGACLMVGVAFVGFVESPYTAIALLSLAGFAHQTLSVTVITMSSDLFKRNEVATVAGMAGTCGNAGVLLFSLLIGTLVPKIGYSPFFIGLAALDILGAVLLWTIVREPRPDGPTARATACPPDRRWQPTRHSSATRSCQASTRTRRSSGSAMTTTSRRRPSSGFQACRSTTLAIWSTGVC